jgi:hypothetical protein
MAARMRGRPQCTESQVGGGRRGSGAVCTRAYALGGGQLGGIQWKPTSRKCQGYRGLVPDIHGHPRGGSGGNQALRYWELKGLRWSKGLCPCNVKGVYGTGMGASRRPGRTRLALEGLAKKDEEFFFVLRPAGWQCWRPARAPLQAAH